LRFPGLDPVGLKELGDRRNESENVDTGIEASSIHPSHEAQKTFRGEAAVSPATDVAAEEPELIDMRAFLSLKRISLQ